MNNNLLSLSNLETSSLWRLNSGKERSLILPIEPDERGRVTQYVKRVYLKRNHTYELSLEVKCSQYVSGELGIGIGGLANTLAIDRKTDGFIPLKKTLRFDEDKEMNFFVGGINQANLSGEIKNVILLETEKDPTIENPVLRLGPEQVFIQEMNDKCIFFGMEDTHFENPSGLVSREQITTAQDMFKLAIQVVKYPELLRVWGEKTHLASFRGPNERKTAIRTLVENAEFESRYTILGAKSGTLLPDLFNLVMLSKDNDDQVFITIIMQTTSKLNRFIETEKMLNLANSQTNDLNDFSEEEFHASAGGIYRLKNNPLQLPEAFCEKIYSFNEDKKIYPASLTKLMTALIVVENIQNLNEQFEIKECDLVDLSGPMIFAGDKISYRDALFVLLLTSCNTMAKALSRVIGEKLIHLRENL